MTQKRIAVPVRAIGATAVLIPVVALVLIGSHHAAEAKRGEAGGSTTSGFPEVVVSYGMGNEVVARRDFGRSGGRAGSQWSCFYFPIVPGGDGLPMADQSRGSVTPGVGELIVLVCYDGGAKVAEYVFRFDPGAPLGPVVQGFDAAVVARNMIPLPDPVVGVSPPRSAAQLVGVASWLWVADDWRPREAAATAGSVTAVITATPVEVWWDPGDGSPGFSCRGPGTVWDDRDRGRRSSCTHTYQVRSTVHDPSGSFGLRATVTYEVSWRASNGQGGVLDPLTRTTVVPVVVHEAQAVIR